MKREDEIQRFIQVPVKKSNNNLIITIIIILVLLIGVSLIAFLIRSYLKEEPVDINQNDTGTDIEISDDETPSPLTNDTNNQTDDDYDGNGNGNDNTCTDTCNSLGYECGNFTICGGLTNCGTCNTGETCESGQCITKCQNECDAEGLSCQNNMPYNCSVGEDGCLNRVNLTQCGTGEICVSGACEVVPDCTDNDDCTSFNNVCSVGICNSSGKCEIQYNLTYDLCDAAVEECYLDAYCSGDDASCPANPFKAQGAACSEGVCNYGECVECIDDTDCQTGETCENNECITGEVCGDGNCATGENCPQDNISCTDNICYEPTCLNGCGETMVPSRENDESCALPNFCNQGECVECIDNDDCETGEECLNGICTPGGGPICGDGECNGDETCVTCPFDCGDCPASNIYVGGYEVNHDFNSISDECMDIIRTKRILFGSRSIGFVTVAGMESLAGKDPKYALNIEQYRIDWGQTIPDDTFNNPKMVHFIFILNPEEERWNYFDDYIRNNPDEIDVAFEYIYSPETNKVNSLYDNYTSALNSLIEDFPNIKFVIATHTLDTVTSPATWFNFEAKEYSDRVMEDYTNVLPIFDLRDIESTRDDDSICQFQYDGTAYRNLCPEYTTVDTIHPDSVLGAERIGKGIFVLLSKMYCEQEEITYEDDGLTTQIPEEQEPKTFFKKVIIYLKSLLNHSQ